MINVIAQWKMSINQAHNTRDRHNLYLPGGKHEFTYTTFKYKCTQI